jgi:hypothetical protein
MNNSQENFLKSAVLSAEESFGIKLSLEKMTQIIGDKMDYEWKSYEYSEPSPYMDTSPREQIAEIIAIYYLGRPWPCYAENVNMEEFYDQLEQKMKADAQ